MENPYEASQTPSEIPKETLDELRERLRRSGVKSKDFDALSLWAKIPGALLIVSGLLFAVITVSSGHIWGVFLPLPGLAVYVVGWGLGKYKPWAWLAAVLVLVPMTLLTTLALIASTIYTGSMGTPAVLLPIAFGYVCWVLLSPTGRMRYRLMVDVMAREAETKQRAQSHGRAVATKSLDEFLQAQPEQSAGSGAGSHPIPELGDPPR